MANKAVVLDGTATHKDLVVPFDAHERRARLSPETTEVQEFPKAVAHDDKGEPIIAANAEHEAELKAALDAAAAAAKEGE